MRLELTSKTELAIRALNALSASAGGGVTRGEDLAAALGTTTNYLPQVMSPLIRSSWVDSTSGPNGGYALGVPISDVSLLDVIESVEGPTDDGQCVFTRVPCPEEGQCDMHRPWSRARTALLNELASTPVAEVFR